MNFIRIKDRHINLVNVIQFYNMEYSGPEPKYGILFQCVDGNIINITYNTYEERLIDVQRLERETI